MSTLREALEEAEGVLRNRDAGWDERLAAADRLSIMRHRPFVRDAAPTLPHNWTLGEAYAGGRSKYIVLAKDGDRTHDESVVDERLEEARRALGIAVRFLRQSPTPEEAIRSQRCENGHLCRCDLDGGVQMSGKCCVHGEVECSPTPEEPVGELEEVAHRLRVASETIKGFKLDDVREVMENVASLLDGAALQREPVAWLVEDEDGRPVCAWLHREAATRQVNQAASSGRHFTVRALAPVAGEEGEDD